MHRFQRITRPCLVFVPTPDEVCRLRIFPGISPAVDRGGYLQPGEGAGKRASPRPAGGITLSSSPTPEGRGQCVG